MFMYLDLNKNLEYGLFMYACSGGAATEQVGTTRDGFIPVHPSQ